MAAEWTSLLEQFGWGDLQDHYSKCHECDDDRHGDDDDCEACANEGQLHWGSFYGDRPTECTVCGLDTHTNDRLIEDKYICLECYLKAHKEACGCGLFHAAEKAAQI